MRFHSILKFDCLVNYVVLVNVETLFFVDRTKFIQFMDLIRQTNCVELANNLYFVFN